MLRLFYKSLLVFLGLILAVYLGAWTSAAAAGSASGELNQNSALHLDEKSSSGSSHQTKTGMQDERIGLLCQMRGGGMMGGQGYQSGKAPQQQYQGKTDGARLFAEHCVVCHRGGGNDDIPSLPLRGAAQLRNINTFRAFVRNPTLPNGSRGPMPVFSPARISDSQLRQLYRYVKSTYGDRQRE